MTYPSSIGNVVPSCLAVLVGISVLWTATDGFRAVTEEAARRLSAAENRPVLPRLVLEDMNGGPLRLGHEPGSADKITFVEFIYTSCATICQTSAGDYAALRDRIERSNLGDAVRLISISFDPLRDEPADLRQYAERHGADGSVWTVARAQPDDVALIARTFGLRVIPDGWGGYQHNAAIHLIDQRGRLAAIVDTDAVDLAMRNLREML